MSNCLKLDDETLRKQYNFCKLTQQWLRFLLHQLNRESSNLPSTHQSNSCLEFSDNSKNSFITENFSLCLTRHFQCTKCQYIWQNPHVSFPVTLNYPFSHSLSSSPSNGETISTSNLKESFGNGENSFVSFVELISNSILTEQTIQAYCGQCQKFQNNITERRYVTSLPNFFAINTGLDNEMVLLVLFNISFSNIFCLFTRLSNFGRIN